MNLKVIALACACLIGAAAQAGTVFSDNFDGNTAGLNKVPTGWTVSNGTVDIIGNGTAFDFYPGNGLYIDLDGSTRDAGVLSRDFALTGGVSYLATLWLSGGARGQNSNEVMVDFGSTSAAQTFSANAPLAAWNIAFTPTSTGLYTLAIANSGGDNIGAILTSVQVSAVPEPGSWALTLAGLAALGFVARRRKPAH